MTEVTAPDSTRHLRVLTYSHDGYGIGHLRRNLRLSTRLVQRFPAASILAATGSRIAHYFEFPENVDYLKLPSMTKLGNDTYVPDGLRIGSLEVSALRSGILESAVRLFAPDVVLVDRYPLGVDGELVAALDALRARRPDATVILGLRDILDSPQMVREEWHRKGHHGAIAERYDAVLVYGDPRVYDAVAEYNLPDPLAEKVTFTGYLSDPPEGNRPPADASPAHRRDRRLAVCTVGGGKDAAHVAWAFLGALETMGAEWAGLLVVGPFLGEEELVSLTTCARTLGVAMHRFIPDLPARLASADVVVSMAGYNTMCEVLAAAVPAVVVPRIRPRVEQLIRASRFAERGAVAMLHPEGLSPSMLRAAMLKRSAVPRAEIRAAVRAGFDLRGLDGAANAVTAALSYRPALAS